MHEKALSRPDLRRRELARKVRRWRVEDLLQSFLDEGVERAFVTFENGEFSLSHPHLLAPLQAFFELSLDFSRHEGVFIGSEAGIPTLFFAFVHDTRRGLSQGGLRLNPYSSLADVLEDGLRLSQGMTRKNALAGLWWGGGKGVVPMTEAMRNDAYRTENTPQRRRLFEAYGRFIASIGGIYYTAEDVGTKTSDMNAILTQNRFVTCIAPELGGSGNPSPFTARGVFRAMQAAWRFLTSNDRLQGIRVAVQGAGNVGAPLIELLDDAGAEVFLYDPNQAAVDALIARRPRLRKVGGDEIFDLDVDVFAPCAIGDQVNSRTIPRIRAKLICGAANNILGEPADAERLRERGIAFVPDYVCNRMGIINCCDEWQGYLGNDVELAAERVYPDTLRVLKHARNLVIPPTEAADELADIEASELHPLLGHRGRRLIDHLQASNWHGRAGHPPKAKETPAFSPGLHEPDLRRRWEREEHFRGGGPALAAAPVSAAFRPHLGSVLSPLLLDVRARALEEETGQRCRRILGADPGGLALQLAVERSLPYEREEVGRPEFVQACRDLYRRNDAAVRAQLHQLGIGFDPRSWLDTLNVRGAGAVRRLFFALKDARLITRERRLSFHCPRCGTVRVSSDVKPTRLRLHHRYRIRLTSEDSERSVELHTFFPELLVGAVALGVRGDGPAADLAGGSVRNPLNGQTLPLLTVEGQEADVTLLVPAYSRGDERAARAHGIDDCPPVFTEDGQIRLPSGETAERDAARSRIVAHLAEAIDSEAGSWAVKAHRCRRCETITNPSPTEQLFVRVDRAVPALRAALGSGAVQITSQRWRRWLDGYLTELEPMCISRQQWWGNELPSDPENSLSTWFSLAAWSLLGAGWPEEAAPEPVSEVFVDPELLRRWILPSQLISLALTGRPAFQKVHVHGVLHVVDRKLVPIEGQTDADPDEERFRFQTVPRPMRKQLGNVVEPATLVRRFGADPVRLAYLLSLGTHRSDTVTLSEGNLRRARRSHHRLINTLGGLAKLARRASEAEVRTEGSESGAGSMGLLEHWIIGHCARAAARAREAYDRLELVQAARELVTAIESLRKYARIITARDTTGHRLEGAARPETISKTVAKTVSETVAKTVAETVAEVLDHLAAAFAPICPFTFDHLRRWAVERGLEGSEDRIEARIWLADLVDGLQGGGATVATPDDTLRQELLANHKALEALAGRPVEIAGEPPAGQARIIGPCVLVKEGTPTYPKGKDGLAAWYRSFHGEAG